MAILNKLHKGLVAKSFESLPAAPAAAAAGGTIPSVAGGLQRAAQGPGPSRGRQSAAAFGGGTWVILERLRNFSCAVAGAVAAAAAVAAVAAVADRFSLSVAAAEKLCHPLPSAGEYDPEEGFGLVLKCNVHDGEEQPGERASGRGQVKRGLESRRRHALPLTDPRVPRAPLRMQYIVVIIIIPNSKWELADGLN